MKFCRLDTTEIVSEIEKEEYFMSLKKEVCSVRNELPWWVGEGTRVSSVSINDRKFKNKPLNIYTYGIKSWEVIRLYPIVREKS